MSRMDPELIRWLQRVTSVGLFIYAAGWLKLSPEILSTVAFLLGGMTGQTIQGYGQVDARALEKLAKLIPSTPPPPPPDTRGPPGGP